MDGKQWLDKAAAEGAFSGKNKPRVENLGNAERPVAISEHFVDGQWLVRREYADGRVTWAKQGDMWGGR